MYSSVVTGLYQSVPATLNTEIPVSALLAGFKWTKHQSSAWLAGFKQTTHKSSAEFNQRKKKTHKRETSTSIKIKFPNDGVTVPVRV